MKNELVSALVCFIGLLICFNLSYAQNRKKDFILKDHDTISVHIQTHQADPKQDVIIKKASTGDISLEANLNVTGAATVSLSHLFDGIKIRYFLGENSALRAHFNFQTRSNNTSSPQNATGQFGEISQSYTTFGLGFGIEFHKDISSKAQRFSPYFGADLILEAKSSSEVWTNYDGSVYSPGKNVDYSGAWANGQNPGGSMFGLRLVTGFDYYIYHHLFVGIEFAYGFQYKINASIDRVESGTIKRTINSGSQFSLGTSVTPGLRIGYLF